MEFTCYKKTYDHKLVQSFERENIRLTVTKVIEFDMCYRQVFYDITMVYGARRIYKSVESNLERVWYIYDTIQHAIAYGRKPIL